MRRKGWFNRNFDQLCDLTGSHGFSVKIYKYLCKGYDV